MSNKHLAIFRQPFLNLILEGKKTIESRFSCVKCAPFGVIGRGDVVLLKKGGGLVLGEFKVAKVKTFDNLTPIIMTEIKDKYGVQICANSDFWKTKQKCRYATLIYVSNLIRYDKPYSYPKKDRRGWVVIKRENSLQQLLFKKGDGN